MTVFTFTIGGDVHAATIDAALRRLGSSSILYLTPSLVGRGSETIFLENEKLGLRIDGQEILLDDIRSVWVRRLSKAFIYTDVVHPADKRHVGDQCRGFLDGLLSILEDKFCVNPINTHGAGISKIRQIKLAALAGLRVPRTILTNDPQELANFRSILAPVCTKPFRMQSWGHERGQSVATTAVIGAEKAIPDNSIALAPMIYQEYIQKSFEVRATIFGNYCSATRINSQKSGGPGSVDWRADDSYLDDLEPIEIPEDIFKKSKTLMKSLDLKFGTFDFIVDESGGWTFLEVNEAGQFLWQEAYCEGCYLAEPFARFLISGDSDFTWSSDQASEELSYSRLMLDVRSDRYSPLRDEPPLPPEIQGFTDERLERSSF